MTSGTYDVVDDVLKEAEGRDMRFKTMSLMDSGAGIGRLDETAGVVARRFGLQEEAVKNWYKDTKNLLEVTDEAGTENRAAAPVEPADDGYARRSSQG